MIPLINTFEAQTSYAQPDHANPDADLSVPDFMETLADIGNLMHLVCLRCGGCGFALYFFTPGHERRACASNTDAAELVTLMREFISDFDPPGPETGNSNLNELN